MIYRFTPHKSQPINTIAVITKHFRHVFYGVFKYPNFSNNFRAKKNKVPTSLIYYTLHLSKRKPIPSEVFAYILASCISRAVSCLTVSRISNIFIISYIGTECFFRALRRKYKPVMRKPDDFSLPLCRFAAKSNS